MSVLHIDGVDVEYRSLPKDDHHHLVSLNGKHVAVLFTHVRPTLRVAWTRKPEHWYGSIEALLTKLVRVRRQAEESGQIYSPLFTPHPNGGGETHWDEEGTPDTSNFRVF